MAELETWRQLLIASRSEVQISAAQHSKSRHQSLIFPPSNALLAKYCTAVLLRAVQNAQRIETAPERNTVAKKFVQII